MVCVAAGCVATRRAAREAQDASRIPAGERTVLAAEAGIGSGKVLTLDDAVAAALQFHPSVAEAGQNFLSAMEQVDEAKGGRQPQLGTDAGYRRATSNSQGRPASSDSDNSYNAGFSGSLLIYDFGRTPALIRAAVARAQAAAENFRAAENDVTFAVRSAYFALAENIDLLLVAEETKRQFEIHLSQVRSLHEVGRRIRYDITKAQVDLGNAQLALIDASNAVRIARAALNRTLGLAEEPGYRIAQLPVMDVSQDLAALVRLAHANQPEFRALREMVTVASNSVDAAVADLYPSLSVQGGLNWAGGSFPLMWNWSGAANAAMTIFDGDIKCSRVMRAVADLRAARARLAAREQQIFSDLSQSVARLDGARQRLALTELIVQQAQESLTLVDERYRIGSATSVEQADAQAALAEAKAQQVRARFDVLNNVAAIKHTVGDPELEARKAGNRGNSKP